MGHKMYLLKEAEDVFALLQGALERTNAPISIISINPVAEDINIPIDEIVAFSRSSDITFQDPEKKGWWVVQPNSGKKEINAFLARLYAHFSPDRSISFQVCYTEVRDYKISLTDVITAIHCNPVPVEGLAVVFVRGPWIDSVKQKLKVSLVLNEPIVKEVLARSISMMTFEHFDLDVQSFTDGLDFENAKTYTSAQPHFVIVDDVLPKKNGIEVVHFLRNQPSHSKFHIFMLTDRISEENMTNAYQMGIDHVLQKPFNLRLFEAMFRRSIERLWYE